MLMYKIFAGGNLFQGGSIDNYIHIIDDTTDRGIIPHIADNEINQSLEIRINYLIGRFFMFAVGHTHKMLFGFIA